MGLSSGGLKPGPAELARVAKATGANIIMDCCQYVEEYQDAVNQNYNADDFAAEMVDQIFEGAWGSDVRAGMVGEIGCQSPWTELERCVMQGDITAQAETGAALNVYPGREADQPQEVMDFVKSEGGIIEFDLFGQESSFYALIPYINMPNDAIRLHHIRSLIERGHLDQIVISYWSAPTEWSWFNFIGYTVSALGAFTTSVELSLRSTRIANASRGNSSMMFSVQ